MMAERYAARHVGFLYGLALHTGELEAGPGTIAPIFDALRDTRRERHRATIAVILAQEMQDLP